MALELQTVESILSAHSPTIEVPPLLKAQRGRVMKQFYKDELLPSGYGFEFQNELQKALFEQLRTGVEQVRTAMFALCNRFGVLSGPLSSPLNQGMVFNRAQDETIWHVDRSDQEDEYYTLLSPADSTVAKTWVAPILHFLSVADATLKNSASSASLDTIRSHRKTTGGITNQISDVADSINLILNTGSAEEKLAIASKIAEKSVLVGGKRGWLMFSDPLVIHNGNLPTGDDKHIMTFDLARKNGGEFRSVYDNHN